MWLELIFAFCSGFLGGWTGFFLASWWFRRSLYNLEVDVADLQERHLRSVRKAAAKERWEGEELVDEKIASALKSTPPTKGWTKWPSLARSENSSETSPNR